jgi:hypothetical protein
MPHCWPGDPVLLAKVVFGRKKITGPVNAIHDLLSQYFIKLPVLWN